MTSLYYMHVLNLLTQSLRRIFLHHFLSLPDGCFILSYPAVFMLLLFYHVVIIYCCVKHIGLCFMLVLHVCYTWLWYYSHECCHYSYIYFCFVDFAGANHTALDGLIDWLSLWIIRCHHVTFLETVLQYDFKHWPWLISVLNAL